MKKNILNLILLIISVTVSLLIVEAGLRLVVPIPKMSHFDTSALVYDEFIQTHAFKPHTKTYMTNGYFNEEVAIDHNGYRDLAPVTEVPVWGLAVGDSQTFGHGIPVTETWPEQLSRQLNKEVYNAGVFGYNLQNYQKVLAKLVPQLKPKTVLIGVTYNDLHRFAEGNVVGTEKLHKNLNRVNNDFWSMLRDFNIKGVFLNSTALGKLLSVALLKIKHSFEDLNAFEDDLRKNIALGLSFIVEIEADLRRQGISLIVVYIPNGNLVRDDIYLNNLKSQAMRKVTQSSFKAHWQNKGFTFVNPSNALEEAYLEGDRERSALLLPVDGHNNGLANQVLATKIKEQILQATQEAP